MFLSDSGMRLLFVWVLLGLSLSSCGRNELSVRAMVQPEYPLDARGHNIQGDVVVGMQIGMDGTVLWVHATAGNPVLAKAAEDNARRWIWGPFPERFTFPYYHEMLYKFRLEGRDACVGGLVATVKTNLPDSIEIFAPPCHPSF